MGRWVVLGLTLGLLASAARAEVMVRVSGEQVDVTATAAPLNDVLDRLAQQTGMEVVYEGTPPRQRVTVTLQGRTASEAVQGILEGQGQNYAIVADPTGRRVQTLLLAGPAGSGTSAGTSSSSPAPRVRRPVMRPPAVGPDMMDPAFDELEEEDPFEDPEFMDPTLEEPPADGEQEPEAPAALPAPGTGALPFPGGQPQVFPASPFTPQPFGSSPVPTAPAPATPAAPTTPPPPGAQAPPE